MSLHVASWAYLAGTLHFLVAVFFPMLAIITSNTLSGPSSLSLSLFLGIYVVTVGAFNLVPEVSLSIFICSLSLSLSLFFLHEAENNNFLLFQARVTQPTPAPPKPCVPTQEDLVRSFIAIVKG